MKEKKIPTREQLKEYRQLISSLDDCGKNLPELIDKIDAFSEEFDVFTKEYVEDGKCGVKDAAGDILVPALFDYVGCFFVDWARDRAVPVTKSGKMALAAHDGKGTLLTDFAYDDIVFNDYYYLYKDGKKGIATPQGCIVIPAVMDKVDIPVKDIVTFMKNRKNKPMIEYLEIDENTYIENDKLKTKINESNNPPKFVSWDEFWDNVYNRISKMKEYDETHNKNT